MSGGPGLIEPVLFAGCRPEVASFDGRIIAVGPNARAAAGRRAEVVRLNGIAWPGLVDSHIHLEGLVDRKLTVDLTGTTDLADCLTRVKTWAKSLKKDGWVLGGGWYNDVWPEPAFPSRKHLDEVAAGRPVFLRRKDGHSAWASSEALRLAGVDATTEDPPGGAIDRDRRGAPTGILRENAMALVARFLPGPSDADFDAGLALVLGDLARLGLTAVHSMDTARCLAALQRLCARGPLPVRVTYNLPLADLAHAERLGVRSGWGDQWLRVWGVKAFLDGSLGSRTAEMLDGSGTVVLAQGDLEELIRRCKHAELNVCLHAIGDGAVRRALDALALHRHTWSQWRPRLEHAQCVDPKDATRMARLGVIASMQPIHAASDRELADALWPTVTKHAYAWRMLEGAGVRLAFGSDAPVETADPLAGIEAATSWRRQAKWHPELALTRAAAVRAYTSGAAYAVGMEKDSGSLRPRKLCDLTVVADGRVEATIAGGRVTFRRKRA